MGPSRFTFVAIALASVVLGIVKGTVRPAAVNGIEVETLKKMAPKEAAKLTNTTDSIKVFATDFVHIYNQQSPDDKNNWRVWYVNDHTFVLGPDGVWHIIGITGLQPFNDDGCTNLMHAVSTPNPANLSDPSIWRMMPFSMGSIFPETLLWAPYIIFVPESGLYHMFYSGGGNNRTAFRIRMATSTDLWTWTRVGTLFTGGIDGRDPMVLDNGANCSDPSQRYIIYYTGTDPDTLQSNNDSHVYLARTSPNLYDWSYPPHKVFEGGRDGHDWGGPCESGFVVQRGVDFFLLTGTWDQTTFPYSNYSHIKIQHSYNPLDFGSVPKGTNHKVGDLYAHAPEVVRDTQGRWFVSSCGINVEGIYLAELHFEGLAEHGNGREYPPPATTHPSPTPPYFAQNVGAEDSSNWKMFFPMNGQHRVTSSGLALGVGLNATVLLLGNRSSTAPALKIPPIVIPPPKTTAGGSAELFFDVGIDFITRNAVESNKQGKELRLSGWNTGAQIFFVASSPSGDHHGEKQAAGAMIGFYVNVTLDSGDSNYVEPDTVVTLHQWPPVHGQASGTWISPQFASSGAVPAANRARQSDVYQLSVSINCGSIHVIGDIAAYPLITVRNRDRVLLSANYTTGLTCQEAIAQQIPWEMGLGMWQGSAIFKNFLVRNES